MLTSPYVNTYPKSVMQGCALPRRANLLFERANVRGRALECEAGSLITTRGPGKFLSAIEIEYWLKVRYG